MIKLRKPFIFGIIFIIKILIAPTTSWECIKNDFKTLDLHGKNGQKITTEFKSKKTLDNYLANSKDQLDYLIRNCTTINETDYLEVVGIVEDVLGQGSFGEVVKSCKENDECWAIKKPAGFGGDFSGLRDIFQELNNSACLRMTASDFELKFMAVIRECYIVKDDSGNDFDPYLTFLMDYYPTDMKKYKENVFTSKFEDLHGQDQETEIGWLYSLALSLRAMHRLRITHRDLKLGNVFVSQSKRAILGDFGISSTDYFHGKDLFGTPNYIDPEIFNGDKGANYLRGDIYSLGVLYSAILDDKFVQKKLDRITLAGGYKNGSGSYSPNKYSYYFPSDLEWMRGMLSLGKERLDLDTVILKLEAEVQKFKNPEEVRTLDNTIARPTTQIKNDLSSHLKLAFKTVADNNSPNGQRKMTVNNRRTRNQANINKTNTQSNLESDQKHEFNEDKKSTINRPNSNGLTKIPESNRSSKDSKKRNAQKINEIKTKEVPKMISRLKKPETQSILTKAKTKTENLIKAKIGSRNQIVMSNKITNAQQIPQKINISKDSAKLESPEIKRADSKLTELRSKKSQIYRSQHEQAKLEQKQKLNRIKEINQRYSAMGKVGKKSGISSMASIVSKNSESVMNKMKSSSSLSKNKFTSKLMTKKEIINEDPFSFVKDPIVYDQRNQPLTSRGETSHNKPNIMENSPKQKSETSMSFGNNTDSSFIRIEEKDIGVNDLAENQKRTNKFVPSNRKMVKPRSQMNIGSGFNSKRRFSRHSSQLEMVYTLI